MHRFITFLVLVALPFFSGFNDLHSQSNLQMLFNYQAVLLDDQDNPLNSTVNLKFSIFDGPDAGALEVWTETQQVTAVNGFVNVYLGKTTPIKLDFNRQLYLEVTIVGNNPFARIPLTSSPYAMFSLRAEVADTANYIRDGSITQDKLAAGIKAEPKGPAGGDLQGTYPNPTIRDEAVTAEKIAAGSVNSEKIQDNSITANDLSANCISTYKIVNGTITKDDMAAGSITSTQILDGSVATADLLDNSVTTGKITDYTILGNDIDTGAVTTVHILNGTIKAEDIEPGVLSGGGITEGAITTFHILNGTILPEDMSTGAVTTTQILDNTILAGDIATGAVTTTQILDNTILAGDIATGAVTTTQILDNTILAGDIATGAVTTTQILDNTIAASDIGTGGVATDEILDGTIATADIGDGQITSAKIADNTITASDIGTGAVGSDEITDNSIAAGDIAADAVTKAKLADDAVGPNEIDVADNYPWTGLHTFGDGTGAHKYKFYSNVPPAGNDATLTAQNTDVTGLALKVLGKMDVSSTLTANSLTLTTPLNASSINIDGTTIVNNATKISVGTLSPSNLDLAAEYSWTNSHTFSDAGNGQYVFYSSVPSNGNNATIYARNDNAGGLGIYSNANVKFAQNMVAGTITYNGTSVTAYNNSGSATVAVVNSNLNGKAMTLTSTGGNTLTIDRTDGDVTTDAITIDHGGITLTNGSINNASTYNTSDGIGMLVLMNAGGDGSAVYADISSTLSPTMYLANNDVTDASVALSIANGGVVLSYVSATGTGDLSDYGYASIIKINQDITTTPSGTSGQMLYIYNSDGSDHTFGGMNVKAGKVSVFIYIDAAWKQLDDPS